MGILLLSSENWRERNNMPKLYFGKSKEVWYDIIHTNAFIALENAAQHMSDLLTEESGKMSHTIKPGSDPMILVDVLDWATYKNEKKYKEADEKREEIRIRHGVKLEEGKIDATGKRQLLLMPLSDTEQPVRFVYLRFLIDVFPSAAPTYNERIASADLDRLGIVEARNYITTSPHTNTKILFSALSIIFNFIYHRLRYMYLRRQYKIIDWIYNKLR